MYAIAFDLDTQKLQELYGSPSWQNAYKEIGDVLCEAGFQRKQGSVYFGDMQKVNSVTCTLVTQKLARKYPWFASSVKDIQMLRIEEDSDLSPALEV